MIELKYNQPSFYGLVERIANFIPEGDMYVRNLPVIPYRYGSTSFTLSSDHLGQPHEFRANNDLIATIIPGESEQVIALALPRGVIQLSITVGDKVVYQEAYNVSIHITLYLAMSHSWQWVWTDLIQLSHLIESKFHLLLYETKLESEYYQYLPSDVTGALALRHLLYARNNPLTTQAIRSLVAGTFQASPVFVPSRAAAVTNKAPVPSLPRPVGASGGEIGFGTNYSRYMGLAPVRFRFVIDTKNLSNGSFSLQWGVRQLTQLGMIGPVFNSGTQRIPLLSLKPLVAGGSGIITDSVSYVEYTGKFPVSYTLVIANYAASEFDVEWLSNQGTEGSFHVTTASALNREVENGLLLDFSNLSGFQDGDQWQIAFQTDDIPITEGLILRFGDLSRFSDSDTWELIIGSAIKQVAGEGVSAIVLGTAYTGYIGSTPAKYTFQYIAVTPDLSWGTITEVSWENSSGASGSFLVHGNETNITVDNSITLTFFEMDQAKVGDTWELNFSAKDRSIQFEIDSDRFVRTKHDVSGQEVHYWSPNFCDARFLVFSRLAQNLSRYDLDHNTDYILWNDEESSPDWPSETEDVREVDL